MQVMLMRLMSKGEYLIVPKGTKFTGAGKLGLRLLCSVTKTVFHQGGGEVIPIVTCTPCTAAKMCKKSTFSWLGAICAYCIKLEIKG